MSKPPSCPTRVEVQIVLNDVGQVDLIGGSMYVQLEISMNWRDPRITILESSENNSQAEIVDEASIWRPNLNIFNRSLDAVVVKPKLFYKDGVCGYDLTFTGKVLFQPGDATARFPFDFANVNIIIDGCDDYLHNGLLDLRIVPQESLHREIFGPQTGGQKAVMMNEQFNPEELQEWTIKYLEFQEIHTTWSRRYHRLKLRIIMQRNPMYYFVKIVMVVTLINLLSLLTFAMDPVRSGAERLSFAATVLVATTAFLYVIHSDLPRTPHLHSLDKLMVISFVAQFVTGLVTAIQIIIMRINDISPVDGYTSSATEHFWLIDLVCASALLVWIVFPLILFWIPKTLRAEKKLTAKDLTLMCPPRSEQHGALLRAGSDVTFRKKKTQ
uniref:Neurotransmitter-gated ion-channel ligand-binding domain-containing protein n=1 Tax=Amphora coffeiformis TaxID=265554 RepID=A0A6S8JGF6_9STRA